MKVTTEDVKKLRETTGAGMMAAKQALTQAGSFEAAVEILRQQGHAAVSKKAGREAKEGLIVAYIHAGGKVGVLVELNCETDFVARNGEFQTLAAEVAMQVAAMEPSDVAALLVQPYIRDTGKSMADLVAEQVAKLGENIQIKRFVRFMLGGE